MLRMATRRLRGVIFDMDGTLTKPGAIDFARIRSRCGVPPGVDILAHTNGNKSLEAIVEEEEELGMQRLALMHDCHELFEWLYSTPLKRGLLTRNNESAMVRTVQLLRRSDGTVLAASEASASATATAASSNSSSSSSSSASSDAAAAAAAEHPFHIMLSRSFTPTKPHPAPILHICAQWGLSPHEVVMVGDSIDDVAAGRAAGALAVLIGDDEECRYYKEALPHADHTVKNLTELKALLHSMVA
jgi:HAD superfamily hydrolase (TIGR01509 family)